MKDNNKGKKTIQTKGNKKIKRFFDEIKDNNNLKELLSDYDKADNKEQRKEILKKIAREFGLDGELIFQFRKYLHYKGKDLNSDSDMCELDFKTRGLVGSGKYLNDFEMELHELAYPVVIRIHKFATGNEIKDFVKRKLSLIEKHLIFTDNETLKLRERKKVKMYKWVYRNRGKFDNIHSLTSAVNSKFKTRFEYPQVHRIIRSEKKRREQTPLKDRLKKEKGGDT